MTDNANHDSADGVDTVIDMQTGQPRTWAEMAEVVRERLPRAAVERVREQQQPITDDDAVVVDMLSEEEVTWAEARRRVAARFDELEVWDVLPDLKSTHTLPKSDGYWFFRLHTIRNDRERARELAWIAKNSNRRDLAIGAISDLALFDEEADWDAIEWIAKHRADPAIVRMAVETLALSNQTQRLQRIIDEGSLGSVYAEKKLQNRS